MAEDKNDMTPPDKNLPASIERHLREIMPDRDLKQFGEQLPPEFISDAKEGLEELKDKKQMESVLKHLNKQMHRQLSVKKSQKKRWISGDLSWSYWAILVIFLLIFAGYFVIRLLLHH